MLFCAWALTAGAAEPTKAHWAFQPPVRPARPAVKNGTWPRNAIDYFILARLEKEGIAPSPEADRFTLIRRLYLDLIGLPPSPADVDAFLKDSSPNAYEKVVERLLASPHYGERWGRQWLDLARYADSNGYSIDAARSIWPYRDWVIRALNADMPFDEFVIEQMAGDLLPNATVDQKIATGFHRNTPINQEGGIDVEQFRVDSIYDRLSTTGSVFLGLTVGCAECHDHKFDPITQKDYYQLFAFLNDDDEPVLELGSPEQVALRKKIVAERTALEKRFKTLDRATDSALEAWERGLTHDTRSQLPQDIQFILNIAINGRDEHQVETLRSAFRTGDKTRHMIGGMFSPEPFSAIAHTHLLLQRNEMEKELTELKQREPNIASTLVLKQRSTPRTTNVHQGGDFLRKGAKVEAGTPAWLAPPAGGKTRLDLARWLVDPRNPLTARVTVNRIWQSHFGLGIVETENDFGTQGTPPAHPELLDWLAREFGEPSSVRSRGESQTRSLTGLGSPNWSLKHIHRLIVTSATYRQSSKSRSELANIDPRNKLLARMPRLRLEAELVRDAALEASGLLYPKIGGPSVFPPQPDGVFKFTQVPRSWKADVGPNRYRRGLYTYFWRSAPHPALMAFDAPDAVMACTRRNRSNTPLQALTLLNDDAFFEFAGALARRVLLAPGDNDTQRIEQTFRRCLSRPPRSAETQRLELLLNQLRSEYAANEAEARKLVQSMGKVEDIPERAAWTMLARVLLNLDEFITRE
ncbi:MAG TPA: DUF1549 and DUF1553 domain-containing protein [Gemmataceae bacterium]|jgi:hypothetical protein|nr:DUF1549 and DUF1553 domain-containing protein [Gemmataceae bacterium]